MNKKPCGCENEVKGQVEELLREQHSHHNHLAELSFNIKTLIGIVQRFLMKFEEAEGTPKGTSYIITQTSPAQSTVYTGKPLGYDGVIRHMLISGPGNVTVILNDNLSLTGSTTIALASCNGNAVPVFIHHKMPVGAKLSLSTDSNAGTGLLAVTAWIEPIVESNPELFRLRR